MAMTSLIAVTVRTTFCCSACGWTAPAQVDAGSERAKTEAKRQAAAERLAKHTLLFVCCPRCGARSKRASWFRAGRVLAVLAISAGFIAVGSWSPYHNGLAPGVRSAICGVIGAIAACFLYLNARRPWVDVARR